MPPVEIALDAVLRRDASFDGSFLYGVVTTRIYCRPGCASRAPRRENVRLFPCFEEAESAGFRPCKRCRPALEARRSPGVSLAERAREYLDAHVDERVTLVELARACHTSPHHVQRTFRRHVGVTPREYVAGRRAERLKERLRDGDTVSAAGFEAGFGSSSRVYEQAGTRLGMTPGTYRKGGAGMRIEYATAQSRAGVVLVAATERGVCSVSLGGDGEALANELRREYPRADVVPAGDDLRGWVLGLVGFVNGGGTLPQMPLDLQASVFQERVWKALQTIPPGEVRTYGEIALMIGEAGAARAVGRACGSNRMAIAIPCHRVVRQDGQVGGYRWGAERKKQLLELEAARRVR